MVKGPWSMKTYPIDHRPFPIDHSQVILDSNVKDHLRLISLIRSMHIEIIVSHGLHR